MTTEMQVLKDKLTTTVTVRRAWAPKSHMVEVMTNWVSSFLSNLDVLEVETEVETEVLNLPAASGMEQQHSRRKTCMIDHCLSIFFSGCASRIVCTVTYGNEIFFGSENTAQPTAKQST